MTYKTSDSTIELTREYLVDVFKTSFSNLEVADSVGSAFKALNAEQRNWLYTDWLEFFKKQKSSKAQVFKHKRSPFLDFFTSVYDLFDSYNFVGTATEKDMVEDFRDLLLLETKLSNESKLIAVALAFGTHASLVMHKKVHKKWWMKKIEVLSPFFPLKERESFFFISYMVFGLSQHGYFSENDIIDYCNTIGPMTTLKQYLLTIAANVHDEYYVLLNYPNDIDTLQIDIEKIIGLSIFYLIKLSQNNSKVSSVSNIASYIVTLEIEHYQEFLNLLFYLISVSEHNTVIFPKVFSSNSLYGNLWDTLINE